MGDIKPFVRAVDDIVRELAIAREALAVLATFDPPIISKDEIELRKTILSEVEKNTNV